MRVVSDVDGSCDGFAFQDAAGVSPQFASEYAIGMMVWTFGPPHHCYPHH